MDSKICFEMSLFIVEAIRGRCASFMIITATVSEIMWWTDKCTYFSSIYVRSISPVMSLVALLFIFQAYIMSFLRYGFHTIF